MLFYFLLLYFLRNLSRGKFAISGSSDCLVIPLMGSPSRPISDPRVTAKQLGLQQETSLEKECEVEPLSDPRVNAKLHHVEQKTSLEQENEVDTAAENAEEAEAKGSENMEMSNDIENDIKELGPVPEESEKTDTGSENLPENTENIYMKEALVNKRLILDSSTPKSARTRNKSSLLSDKPNLHDTSKEFIQVNTNKLKLNSSIQSHSEDSLILHEKFDSMFRHVERNTFR